MPHDKIAAMSGIQSVRNTRHSHMDHDTRHTASGCPLTQEEFREFLKEEQREGKHPVLRGKHF